MLQIMKYILIDKVTDCLAGQRIVAVKSVSLAEEYLADHFPAFPVTPGVFLLQGLVEAASWLVRQSQDFAHSMILLEETKNVKYKSFAAPGMQVRYEVNAKTIDEKNSSFTGSGIAADEPIVEAKFTLRHFNLYETDPGLKEVDQNLIAQLKQRWTLLWR